MKCLRFGAAALLLASCAAPPPSQKPTAPENATQPRAAAPCRARAGAHCIAVVALDSRFAEVATVAADDLVRSGRFSALRREDFPELPRSAGTVEFSGWQQAGVDDVLLLGPGKAERSFKLTLLELSTQRKLLDDEVALASAVDRAAAHRAADLAYERITGQRGIASTAIAYVQREADASGPYFRLMLADADGENARVIAQSREPMLSPAWSPDGSQLAWVGYDRGPSAIYVQDLKTGRSRKLISERGGAAAPAFSPDGRKLAYALNDARGTDLYLLDLASGARRPLTHGPGINTEPTFSPDGRRLVFTSDRGGQPQLYQLDLAGGPARLLLRAGKQTLRPCYSPDGASLALVALQGGRYRIGLWRFAGGGLELISDGPGDESPSFAPDGSTLLYGSQSERSGRGELRLVSLIDAARSRLQADADIRGAAWSPYRSGEAAAVAQR